MSDTSNTDLDGLDFDDRTTKDIFNERLQQARENSVDDGLEDRIDFDDFYSEDTEHLKKQLEKLQFQVDRMENQVVKMEHNLATRRARRNKEASLTNMTPEERAEYVIQQEKEEEEGKQENIPDLDVIFEYILLLGSSGSDEAGDLSRTDFLKPHAGIRKNALNDALVKRQAERTSIRFIEANNILDSNTEDDGDIRHCSLAGRSHNQDFTLKFDVLEPAMVMNNLSFDLGIEMQLEVGEVFEKVKEECNVLAFFHLLSHYALLEKDRKTIFDKLLSKYTESPVSVEMLSQSRLKFEGEINSGFYLILEWKMITKNTYKYRLDANATDHIVPEITLDAVAQPSAIEKDENNVLGRINHKFSALVETLGVLLATETFINKIFVPS